MTTDQLFAEWDRVSAKHGLLCHLDSETGRYRLLFVGENGNTRHSRPTYATMEEAIGFAVSAMQRAENRRLTRVYD